MIRFNRSVLFLVIPVLIFMMYVVIMNVDSSLTNNRDEYICYPKDDKDFSHCKKGDWMYVNREQVPIYCSAANLRGGVKLNKYVMPLFNGGEVPRDILCIYRGKPRLKRTN